MSDVELYEIECMLTEEEYFEAEKIAKKHGYRSAEEFILYCMQKYLKETEE